MTKSHQNACDNTLDWNCTVENLLSKYELQHLINEPKPNIGQIFIDRAKDRYHDDAFAQITKPGSKLRTYSLFKHDIGREDYLVQIRNTRLRQILTKFRLSNHRLMIERGRHLKLDVEDRKCPMCEINIEDEKHFLITCRVSHRGGGQGYGGRQPPMKNFSMEINSQRKFI